MDHSRNILQSVQTFKKIQVVSRALLYSLHMVASTYVESAAQSVVQPIAEENPESSKENRTQTKNKIKKNTKKSKKRSGSTLLYAVDNTVDTVLL